MRPIVPSYFEAPTCVHDDKLDNSFFSDCTGGKLRLLKTSKLFKL